MATATIETSACSKLEYDNGVYATVHDAASANTFSADIWNIQIGQFYDATPTYGVYRAGLLFSLSEIPEGSIVSVATLSLYGLYDFSTTDYNVTIVSGADFAAIAVAADYGDLLNDTTSYGALTTSGWVLEDWNIITLNAAGLSALNTAIATRVFRIGLRSSRDIDETIPTGNETVYAYGTQINKKPKLTLTYLAGEGRALIAVVETRFHYVDAYGVERYLEGTAV